MNDNILIFGPSIKKLTKSFLYSHLTNNLTN